MGDGDNGLVGGIVKSAAGHVVVERMVENNGRPIVREPSTILLLAINQVIGAFTVKFVRLGIDSLRIGGANLAERYPIDACRTRGLAIIGTGDAHHLKIDRMGGRVTHGHFRLVVQFIFCLVHGKITGIAYIGMLDHHILVLPVIDIKGYRIHFHRRIFNISTQHTYIHIIMIPVVPQKIIVVRQQDPIIELLFGITDQMLLIPLAFPGKNKFQIGFPCVSAILARFPIPGVGIHGIGIEIAVGALVKNLFVSAVGIGPMRFEEIHGITLVGEELRGIHTTLQTSRCAGKVHIGNTVHQIDAHFFKTGRPVFLDGQVSFFIFPSGIQLHIVIGLYPHSNFTGETLHIYASPGNQLTVTAFQCNGGLAAHDKTILPVIRRRYEIRIQHQRLDGRKRSVVLLQQLIQLLLGSVDQCENRGLDCGRSRENQIIHLLGGKFQPVGLGKPSTFFYALMEGRAGRCVTVGIEKEVYPVNLTLVIGTVAGSRFGFIGPRLRRIVTTYQHLQKWPVPLREAFFPGTGREDKQHHEQV